MQTALRLLDRDMMDKQRALDAALGQIERAFGKGSIMKLGSREAASDIDVISTGSLGLDIALGIGGLSRGRGGGVYRPGKLGTAEASPPGNIEGEEVGRRRHLATRAAGRRHAEAK